MALTDKEIDEMMMYEHDRKIVGAVARWTEDVVEIARILGLPKEKEPTARALCAPFFEAYLRNFVDALLSERRAPPDALRDAARTLEGVADAIDGESKRPIRVRCMCPASNSAEERYAGIEWKVAEDGTNHVATCPRVAARH